MAAFFVGRQCHTVIAGFITLHFFFFFFFYLVLVSFAPLRGLTFTERKKIKLTLIPEIPVLNWSALSAVDIYT